MTRDYEVLLDRIYHARPCYICRKCVWCEHREPLVDAAEVSQAHKEPPSSPEWGRK